MYAYRATITDYQSCWCLEACSGRTWSHTHFEFCRWKVSMLVWFGEKGKARHAANNMVCSCMCTRTRTAPWWLRSELSQGKCVWKGLGKWRMNSLCMPLKWPLDNYGPYLNVGQGTETWIGQFVNIGYMSILHMKGSQKWQIPIGLILIQSIKQGKLRKRDFYINQMFKTQSWCATGLKYICLDLEVCGANCSIA